MRKQGGCGHNLAMQSRRHCICSRSHGQSVSRICCNGRCFVEAACMTRTCCGSMHCMNGWAARLPYPARTLNSSRRTPHVNHCGALLSNACHMCIIWNDSKMVGLNATVKLLQDMSHGRLKWPENTVSWPRHLTQRPVALGHGKAAAGHVT